MVAKRPVSAVAVVLAALLVGSVAAQAPANTVWGVTTAINCGGQAIPADASSDGVAYIADAYFSPSSLPWGRPVVLPDQHRTLRYSVSGPLYYTVPVPMPGYYRVNLTWTELYQGGPNERGLVVGVGADVAVHGPNWADVLLMDTSTVLDIWSLAGGNNVQAVSSVFPAPQTGASEVWANNSVFVVISHTPISPTGLPMLGTLQLLGEVLPPTQTPSPTSAVGSTMAPTATSAPVHSTSPAATMAPSMAPSPLPSTSPTAAPTMAPSPIPSTTSTTAPTVVPTMAPTMSPSMAPSPMPSTTSTAAPTMTPTTSTPVPTMTPTTSTAVPTMAPSMAPSPLPSTSPTVAPTMAPSPIPSTTSTTAPTVVPTMAPTMSPSMAPSPMPSTPPTGLPMGIAQHVTIHAERQNYSASAFVMSLGSVPVSFSMSSATANSTIRAVTVEQCPVMAMADLGVSYYHVLLQGGAHHVPHLHPRAAEVLLVTAGTVDVFFVEESRDSTGPTPRLIRNTVAAAGVTLFPRGLLHGVSCVSASPCAYVSTLTHADPGVVLAGATVCDGPVADVAAVLGVPHDDAAVVCAGVSQELAASQATT